MAYVNHFLALPCSNQIVVIPQAKPYVIPIQFIEPGWVNHIFAVFFKDEQEGLLFVQQLRSLDMIKANDFYKELTNEYNKVREATHWNPPFPFHSRTWRYLTWGPDRKANHIPSTKLSDIEPRISCEIKEVFVESAQHRSWRQLLLKQWPDRYQTQYVTS